MLAGMCGVSERWEDRGCVSGATCTTFGSTSLLSFFYLSSAAANGPLLVVPVSLGPVLWSWCTSGWD